MNRRPPELKTTDTLFPYTRPFRTEEKRRHRPIRRKRCRGSRAEAQRPVWRRPAGRPARPPEAGCRILSAGPDDPARRGGRLLRAGGKQSRRDPRSEEHTSELQSLMRISYAVFCLKKTIRCYTYQHIHLATPTTKLQIYIAHILTTHPTHK